MYGVEVGCFLWGSSHGSAGGSIMWVFLEVFGEFGVEV